MSHIENDLNLAALFDENFGDPIIKNGQRFLTTESGIEVLSDYLIGFDEFDADMVLGSMQDLGIDTFVVRSDRFVSTQIPKLENEDPWDAAIELARRSAKPVLAHLGGGYQFVTAETCKEDIKVRGDTYRETLSELKKYREVNLNQAYASEKLQRVLKRDYNLTFDDLTKIRIDLNRSTFIATRCNYVLEQAIQHVVESRDKLGQPVVMRFNEDLLIADFGVTEEELDTAIKLRWSMAIEQAELRDDLSFDDFTYLDLSDTEAVLAWLLRAEEQEVCFVDYRADIILERFSLYGYTGKTPDQFWRYCYSEDDRKLKEIVSNMNDEQFNDLLINAALSVFENGGGPAILKPLIEFRANLKRAD